MDISGLIIEGVCSTGKSSALLAMQTSPRFLARGFSSLVCLTEHHTQRVLEPKEESEGLTVEDNLGLLNETLRFLSGLGHRAAQHTWSLRGRTAHQVGFILERFHLTHAVHYAHMSWQDVAPIDAELGRLGGKLVLLAASRTALRERLFADDRAEGQAYLESISPDKEKLLDHFLHQQDELLALAEKSCLKCKVWEGSTISAGELGEAMADFWL